MSVTMKDIAEEAGGNVSTVSRALKNDGSISEEVRRRIVAIAEEKHYKRKGPVRSIAFVTDQRYFSSTSQFYSAVIEGVEIECKKRGYGFQFESLEPDQFDPSLGSVKNAEGIIFTSWFHDEFLFQAKEAGIPLVLVDYYIPGSDFISILPDKIDGTIKAVEYLVSLGHRDILFVVGNPISLGAEDRRSGFKRALKMYNLPGDTRPLLECDYSINGAYETVLGHLTNCGSAREDTPFPTAILGGTDTLAIGAMEAVKSLGLSVPGDVSIMGFDDISLAAEVVPALTTMEVRKKTLGRLAVENLITLIEGNHPGYHKVLLTPSVLPRASTAPPR